MPRHEGHMLMNSCGVHTAAQMPKHSICCNNIVALTQDAWGWCVVHMLHLSLDGSTTTQWGHPVSAPFPSLSCWYKPPVEARMVVAATAVAPVVDTGSGLPWHMLALDEGWKRLTAWTSFLTNWALLNPNKKFMLNPWMINKGMFLRFRQIFVNSGPMRLELVAVAEGPDFNYFSFTSWSATRHSKNVRHSKSVMVAAAAKVAAALVCKCELARTRRRDFSWIWPTDLP